MSAHTIELDVLFRNGDSGEDDERTYPVELAEGQLEAEIAALRAEVSRDTLVAFVKGLYQEPDSDGAARGVAYEPLLTEFAYYGHERLGWHDVSVMVKGIRIDGEAIEISDDQMDEVMRDELFLQLVRNDPDPASMYIAG